MSFDRLIDAIRQKQNPTVAGLDPKLEYIPSYIVKGAIEEYGETLEGAAAAVFTYNCGLIDALADIVPAVKPQAAYYERFGWPGMRALAQTIEYARQKGMYVITDGKRNDIGSTMEAYAAAHLGRVKVGDREYRAFAGDALTVNGYLGTDGIKPLLDICAKEDAGIFVLVKTSNPSSGELQDRLIDGRPLYEWVGEKVAEWGADCMGDSYSYVGAVVGATYPEQGKILRKVMPKSFILVPGYGAQGGKGADLVHFFNEDGLGAIVNSSRGIICAYKQDKYKDMGITAENFADASRKAVEDMIEDISGALANR